MAPQGNSHISSPEVIRSQGSASRPGHAAAVVDRAGTNPAAGNNRKYLDDRGNCPGDSRHTASSGQQDAV